MSEVIVAPFTHGDIRDWPPASFVALIDLLLRRLPVETRIRLTGTRSQWLRACEIARGFDPARVSNDCGRTPWPDVVAAVRKAACVIGNNSGLTHLSAMYGVPTVCVFGGAHQRLEWRPLGERAITLSRAIACSPCNLHRTRDCPYDKACLRRITPEEVGEAVFAAMARSARAA